MQYTNSAIFQNEHMKLSIFKNLQKNVLFGDSGNGTTVIDKF